MSESNTSRSRKRSSSSVSSISIPWARISRRFRTPSANCRDDDAADDTPSRGPLLRAPSTPRTIKSIFSPHASTSSSPRSIYIPFRKALENARGLRNLDPPVSTPAPKLSSPVSKSSLPMSPQPTPSLSLTTPPTVPPSVVDDVMDGQEISAKFIFDQLMSLDIGCGAEGHAQALQKHLDSDDIDDDNHHSLSATYEMDVPVVKQQHDGHYIGLDANVFPEVKGESRTRFVDGSNLETVFTGLVGREGPPRNICLHQEFRPAVHCTRESDIDSILVFPESLGAFKTDVHLCYTRQVQYNMDSSLHLTRDVSFVDADGARKQRRLPLHNIPHLYLGTVQSLKNSSIFLVCPEMYDAEKKNTYLYGATTERFFDDILGPAYRQHLPSGVIQHMPPSSMVAEDKARAQGVEHQSHTYERGLRRHRDYPIGVQYLDAIWASVQSAINDDSRDLQMFRRSFLFVDVKNTKLQFRSSTSVLDSIHKFERTFRQTFDRDRCEYHVDLAMEICPPQPPGSSKRTSPAVDDEHGRKSHENGTTTVGCSEEYAEDFQGAVVYHWKHCCLRRLYDRFVRGPFRGRKGTVHFYHNGHLRDSSCMTIEPPRQSQLHAAGFSYGQYYVCTKEIEDAQKIRPFDHDDLWKLSIDPQLYLSSDLGNPRAQLVRSYLGAKGRVLRAYQASLKTSFGVRFEFRVRGDLLQAIKRVASAAKSPPLGRLTANPECVWSLPTSTFVEFMLGNYEKLTSAIDITLTTAPRVGVSKERSRLLLALFKCLRQFANSNPARDGILWRDRRVNDDGVATRGLGFESTMATSGFAWWQTLVDWERLTIPQEHAGQLTRFDSTLIPYYQRSARLMQDTDAMMAVCYDLLETAPADSTYETVILKALSHFIIRQYRRDVLDLLVAKSEVVSRLQTDEEKDAVCFSYAGLCEVLVQCPPHLASGNRTKAGAPEKVFEWLMGTGPGWGRDFMDGLPNGQPKAWRTMVLKAQLLMQNDPALHQRFQTKFRDEWYTYMWVFPYPGNGSCISTATKQGGKRVFWSGCFRGRQWRFGQGHYMTGHPPAWPTILQMDETSLRTHLRTFAKMPGPSSNDRKFKVPPSPSSLGL